MAQFRPLRQHRYNILVGEFFAKSEAQVLSSFRFSLPYIQTIRQDRAELVGEVNQLGLSHRQALIELRSRIDLVYQINGWKDAYAMIRDYRQRGIDRGEYVPPPSKPRKPKSRGGVTAQRKRGRAKSQTRASTAGEVVLNPDTGRYEPRFYA